MRKLLLTLMIGCVLSFVAISSDILDVYFINVGHGDAILVKYGTTEWLIDTGYKNAWPSTSICSDLLDVEVDLPLEYFILSHTDLDHYSALDLFMRPCRIQTAFSSRDPSAGQVIAADAKLALDCDQSSLGAPAIGSLSADSPLLFSQSGLIWEMLHPSSDFAISAANTNDKSVVLMLTYGCVSFLLPGDIETLPTSADTWSSTPGILILKAPHHGRANSATLALAELLRPDLVVVSTGDCVPETGVAIAQLGIPLFSTSTNGTIHISTDGESVWVTTDSLSGQIADCSDQ